MNTELQHLERQWMRAVQQQDTAFLEQLLDNQFVCTAWSSGGELTQREEYLAGVNVAEFGCFDVAVDHVQTIGDTAVVRCRLQCECMLGEQRWNATFLVTDVWVRSEQSWKAVSRHASVPLGAWPGLMPQEKERQPCPILGRMRMRRSHAESA